MISEVRCCAHLRAICTLFAKTYEGLICAYFDSEVLLETHLHAFGIVKTVVLCNINICINHFGGALSHTPPCDLHIICEYLFALEVRADSGLYNTK